MVVAIASLYAWVALVKVTHNSAVKYFCRIYCNLQVVVQKLPRKENVNLNFYRISEYDYSITRHVPIEVYAPSLVKDEIHGFNEISINESIPLTLIDSCKR